MLYDINFKYFIDKIWYVCFFAFENHFLPVIDMAVWFEKSHPKSMTPSKLKRFYGHFFSTTTLYCTM